ncbi:MAG: DUF4926 domain-containing protein [Bacilli bacterium]|nr:DUF4926 domain-containing protein [Bacilli bacterium]
MKAKLFDIVRTTKDVGQIKAGSIGAVVEIWEDSVLYEIEIFDEDGDTVDYVTLKYGDFVPLTPEEVSKLKTGK